MDKYEFLYINHIKLIKLSRFYDILNAFVFTANYINNHVRYNGKIHLTCICCFSKPEKYTHS